METKLVEKSSQVKAIGHEKESKIFQVVYKNDTTYHYYNIEEDIWEGAKVADSVGSYIAKHVKIHSYKKIS